MTPLERIMRSINAAEEALMGDYSPQAQTAKGHLHIARLATAEAIKNKNASERPEAFTSIP